PVVVSEIHGMAQRGGVVESAVLIGEVTSPIVSPGEADVLVSFEPLETMRIIGKCHKDSLVISNAQPQPPFTVAVGQGKYPDVDGFLKKLTGKVGKVIEVRGNDLAEQAGNPLSLNMVMLGALFGAKGVAVSEEKMKETISKSTKKAFLDSNLKAFDLGKQAAQAQM
ncbi:MAG: indolepyruvate oxidoreductase subunit beta, partial [Deltaproteobacteria bacterium]|nr:indolepyruvate oxidoreductase subunit beta [Deltaproteobacteria bacterium]